MLDQTVEAGFSSWLCLRLHAVARWFGAHHCRFFGQWIRMVNRIVTGADIDMGARVSMQAFLPHTGGIVIGETAIVEAGVVLMPGVVLGATGRSQVGRRHPHLCRDARIGVGAVILGPIVIGERALVGANAVVLVDVEPGHTAVGVPAKAIAGPAAKPTKPTMTADTKNVPDGDE